MLFKDSYITNAGVALFARVTAQKGKLIWTKAATSSNSDAEAYTTQQMNSITELTFGTLTSSGSVTSAVVSDDQETVSLFSELNNETYSGVVHLYGAWAKVEGDESDTLVVIARCGAGVTPTTINSFSNGRVKAFVNFSVKINTKQVSSVEVSEADYYATSAALNNEQVEREKLALRIVTTHTSNSDTTGEEQDVYGIKHFYDGLTLSGQESHISFIVNPEYPDNPPQIIPYAEGLAIKINNNLTGWEGVVFKIADSEYNSAMSVYRESGYWNLNIEKVNSDNVITSSITSSTSTDVNIDGNVIPVGNNKSIGTTSKKWNTVYSNSADFLSLTTGTVIPQNTTSGLGSQSKKWNDCYLKNVYSDTLRSSEIVPTNDASTLGKSNSYWYYAYLNNAKINNLLDITKAHNFIPSTDDSYDLGSTTSPWGRIIANKYCDSNGDEGELIFPPSQSSESSTSIVGCHAGSIVVMAFSSNLVTGGQECYIGQEVTIGASQAIPADIFDRPTTISGQKYLPAGKYKALSYCKASNNIMCGIFFCVSVD